MPACGPIADVLSFDQKSQDPTVADVPILCFTTTAMWHFAKSVILGALAGAAPMLLLTLLLAAGSLPEVLIGDRRLFPVLLLAALPLIVATPIVFAASLVVGLPLTLFLHRQGRESGAAYIGVGAFAGFFIPIAGLLFMEASAGYWIGILGAVSGAVTGRTWWVSFREQKVGFSE